MPEIMVEMSPRPPLLLVSVRDASEAHLALAGGCDILDVKEPARGSLGMAEPATIADVLRVAREGPRSALPLVTAALGETSEWSERRDLPVLPIDLAFLKLGLARSGGGDWRSAWLRVRDRFEEAAGCKLAWIAVAYADWESAAAPAPEAMIDAAVETACAGVLFDTHGKHGGRLLELIDPCRLARWTEAIRAAGLVVATAGGLTQGCLPAIQRCGPDIIAIRGAACRDGRRTSPIAADAVRSFRARMHAIFSESTPHRRSGTEK